MSKIYYEIQKNAFSIQRPKTYGKMHWLEFELKPNFIQFINKVKPNQQN